MFTPLWFKCFNQDYFPNLSCTISYRDFKCTDRSLLCFVSCMENHEEIFRETKPEVNWLTKTVKDFLNKSLGIRIAILVKFLDQSTTRNSPANTSKMLGNIKVFLARAYVSIARSLLVFQRPYSVVCPFKATFLRVLFI